MVGCVLSVQLPLHQGDVVGALLLGEPGAGVDGAGGLLVEEPGAVSPGSTRGR